MDNAINKKIEFALGGKKWSKVEDKIKGGGWLWPLEQLHRQYLDKMLPLAELWYTKKKR